VSLVFISFVDSGFTYGQAAAMTMAKLIQARIKKWKNKNVRHQRKSKSNRTTVF
jgi:hypothetical protein